MRQLGVNDNDEIKTTDEMLNNDNAKIHVKNEKRISQNATMITMVCFVMCFTMCPCACMYMSYQRSFSKYFLFNVVYKENTLENKFISFNSFT